MGHIYTLALLACGLLFSIASLAQNNQEVLSDTAYLPPVVEYRGPPAYPRSQIRMGNVGAVELSFMVDSQGEPFEIIVLRSTHNAFESNTISAVEGYRYKPASIDGSPVAARQSTVVFFEMEGQYNTVSKKFSRNFDRAQKMFVDRPLDERKLEKISAHIKKVTSPKKKRMCEHAFSYLLQYQYAFEKSDPSQQINALNMLLMFDRDEFNKWSCLNLDQTVFFRNAHLELLRANRHFGEELTSYLRFNKLHPDLAVKHFTGRKEEIAQSSSTVSGSSREVELPDRGYAVIELFGGQFSIGSVEGALSELKLRCDTGFLELEPEADKFYQIPENLQRCELQVIGDAMTRLTLNQTRGNYSDHSS
ncbi:MAG: energy transducer TonB [Pseudomonadota bacterium]